MLLMRCMMSIIGYKRVSSESQSRDRQDLGGLDKVFEEKLSGKSASDRPALIAMIDYAREGDTVKVHSIDRLARDLRDLQSIISQLNDKGVTISFLSESLTFSAGADDACAKLQLQMMGAFAEFERNIIRKRQADGIAKAKERGVYKSRKRKTVIDRDAVRKLKADGLSTYKIADQMGISRMSVHRILNNAA
jgi:DNA invertase Pin-like site-specific DNA recombinase